MDFTQIATTLIPATASLFAGGQVGDLVALADVKQEIDLTTATYTPGGAAYYVDAIGPQD